MSEKSKAWFEGGVAYFAGHLIEDAVKYYPIDSQEFEDWVAGYEEAKINPQMQRVIPKYDRDRGTIDLDFPLGDGSTFGVSLTEDEYFKMLVDVLKQMRN